MFSLLEGPQTEVSFGIRGFSTRSYTDIEALRYKISAKSMSVVFEGDTSQGVGRTSQAVWGT